MKIPELTPEVRETFINIIKRNTPTTESIIYLGESHGGYVFRKKRPKYMRNMILGMPIYLFVKNGNIFPIDENHEDMYYDFEGLDVSFDDEDKCYTITLDDENK